MEIKFNGKVALITGASTGIGAATAVEFGKAGAAVVVNFNKSVAAAHKVVEKIEKENGKSIAIQADVSQKIQVEKLIQAAVTAYGTIDILVNNAGGLIDRKLFGEVDETLWDEVMDVNVKSVYLCTRAVLPIMKKNNYGRIINITSIAARSGGGPGAGPYAASKAAVMTLTKNLARELAGTGITVNAVAPGVITTPFHDKFTPPEVRKMFLNSIPLKREGKPEDIAYAILFLASDYAEYILGETIEVNGGMLMD